MTNIKLLFCKRLTFIKLTILCSVACGGTIDDGSENSYEEGSPSSSASPSTPGAVPFEPTEPSIDESRPLPETVDIADPPPESDAGTEPLSETDGAADALPESADASDTSDTGTTDGPDVEAEKAACEACNGEWGRHGLSPFESCNCRTSDFGKACQGSEQCEGQCLADGEPEQVVTDPGPPAKGYFVGQCSEFEVSYGCHQVLSYSEDPVPLDEPPPMLCWD